MLETGDKENIQDVDNTRTFIWEYLSVERIVILTQFSVQQSGPNRDKNRKISP